MAASHAPSHAHHSQPTAADLLRQAMLHSKAGRDEDPHDHIGSGPSTPPNGTATPRPDLHDKRLPQLANSYFVQVRDSLPSQLPGNTSASPTSATNPAPFSENESAPGMSKSTAAAPPPAGGIPLPTAPSSPQILSESASSSSLPDDEINKADPASKHAYPTPPLSHSSSLHAMDKAEGGGGAEGTQSPCRKRSWEQRARSFVDLPPQLSRETLPSTLSNVITKPEVSAHISNPTSEPCPIDPASALASRCTSISPSPERQTQSLTRVAPQNTPPQTPRTGSQAQASKDEDRSGSLTAKPAKSSRSSSNGSHSKATIGQLKGQLEIGIEEARGIKPSIDPYVVCIFQLNEVISGGPKDDEMDTAIESGNAEEENLVKSVAMKRLGSGSGTPMAIPAISGLRSRQTSQSNIAGLRRGSKPDDKPSATTDPVWHHTATFDVVGENNEVDISVYDRANNESFIGHVRIPLNLDDYEHQHEAWYKLESREGHTERVSGEIRLKLAFHASGKKSFGPDDFEILKLIGKGTFGQVFQVRKKDTKRIYAMKVLSKKVIVQKKEIQHTIGERNILVRTATTESPFIVGLKFSFQTSADLYLVTDYMSGGELFWHLQKEGRFVEERAKFYIAELILALRHLHQHDIVYRDLKPENILLDANGHIALCDFGLSKANLSKNDTTNTFCGTTEYLAPEVLLDEQGYTKMVDFWSLGVLVFEMCCGWSPFYAEDTQQMYKNIAFGKVRFPRDALSTDGRAFVKGLLNRNPAHRLGAKGDAEELMAHPFFNDVDWNQLSKKMTQPPFKPKLKGELDTSNFDPEFTNALAAGEASSLNARAAALASGVSMDSTPLSPTMQNQFKGFTFVDESTLEQQFGDRDEDLGMDEPSTAAPSSKPFSGRAGDRMSGLEPTTSANVDADFNHGMLDDI